MQTVTDVLLGLFASHIDSLDDMCIKRDSCNRALLTLHSRSGSGKGTTIINYYIALAPSSLDQDSVTFQSSTVKLFTLTLPLGHSHSLISLNSLRATLFVVRAAILFPSKTVRQYKNENWTDCGTKKLSEALDDREKLSEKLYMRHN